MNPAPSKAKSPVAPTTRDLRNAETNVGDLTSKSTATHLQRERILSALRLRAQTTDDLRRIGVFQPAARVKELRDQFGYEITTTRVVLVDANGYTHPRAALYSLHTPGRPGVGR